MSGRGRFLAAIILCSIGFPAILRRSGEGPAIWAAVQPVAAPVALGVAGVTLLAAVVAGVRNWRHA